MTRIMIVIVSDYDDVNTDNDWCNARAVNVGKRAPGWYFSHNNAMALESDLQSSLLSVKKRRHKWGILQFLFGFIKNSKQWLNTE